MAHPISQLRLPPTVQGVLASRIDRLGAEQKDLLQTLAVLGRESLLGLIRQVGSFFECGNQGLPCRVELRGLRTLYNAPEALFCFL